jgi:hypothetical protein
MKIIKIVLVIVFIINIDNVFSQSVPEQVRKIENTYLDRDYYTTLNLCKDVLSLCKNSYETECSFTNVIKDIFRYKGLVEYEIYKQEKEIKRLNEAIQSLKTSYQLYNDPEILYLSGYLLMLQHIQRDESENLEGVIIAWEGILKLYGQENWMVSKNIIYKLYDYIKLVEKFTVSKSEKNYQGRFAKYMIYLACSLAEKAEFKHNLTDFFNSHLNNYLNEFEGNNFRSNLP